MTLFSLFDNRKIELIICLSKKLFIARVIPKPSVIPWFCASVFQGENPHSPPED